MSVIRGLLIGRFQPFHFGHLSLVKYALKKCNELVIIIGNSESNYTPRNPFTSGERIWMIHDTLTENNIDLNRVFIIPLVTDENNARWFGTLKSMIPPINMVFTGNKFVKLLLQNESISIVNPVFENKFVLNGTYIRNLIINEKDEWKDLIPSSVIHIINEIDGIQRIKLINSSKLDFPSNDSEN